MTFFSVSDVWRLKTLFIHTVCINWSMQRNRWCTFPSEWFGIRSEDPGSGPINPLTPLTFVMYWNQMCVCSRYFNICCIDKAVKMALPLRRHHTLNFKSTRQRPKPTRYASVALPLKWGRLPRNSWGCVILLFSDSLFRRSHWYCPTVKAGVCFEHRLGLQGHA